MSNKKVKHKKRITSESKGGNVSNINKPSLLNKPWFPPIVILLLGLIAMGPVIGNEFINFDDPELIYNNPIVTSGESGWIDFFSKFLFTPFYKPLVFLLWHMEYQIAGPNPTVFHSINLLFHLINSLLVFYIFRSLCQLKTRHKNSDTYISLLIAGLFAAHPLHVESVAWAVERKDVLYGFFFLGSILTYLFARQRKASPVLPLVASLVLFIAALLSKSPAIVLPAVLFVVDWYIDKKWTRESMLRLVPYGAIALFAFYFYGLLGDFNQYALGITEGITGTQQELLPNNLADLPAIYRRIVLINTRFWLFVFHLFLPIKLSIIYPRFNIIQSLGFFIHFFPLLTLGVGFLLIKWRNKKHELIFGLSLFIIFMAPVLAISGAGSNFLSDRYTYLSSLGIFFIIAYYFQHWYGGKKRSNERLVILSSLVGLILLAMLSHARSTTWKTSESLWSDVIQKYPDQVWDAYNGRGLYLKNHGNPQQALQDFQKAVEINPNPTTYVNRALIYQQLGQLPEAKTDFNEAIRLKPNHVEAYINRGGLHFNERQYAKALADLDRAIELDDRQVSAYANRASVYAMTNRNDAALADLNKAAEINPFYPQTYKNRALLKYNQKDYQGAFSDCETYIALEEQADFAYNLLGLIYMERNDYQNALQSFNTALDIKPNEALYINNRSRCKEALKDYYGALNDLNMLRQLGYQVDPAMYQRISQAINR